MYAEKSAVRRSWRAKRWMKGSRDEQLNVPVGASRRGGGVSWSFFEKEGEAGEGAPRKKKKRAARKR